MNKEKMGIWETDITKPIKSKEEIIVKLIKAENEMKTDDKDVRETIKDLDTVKGWNYNGKTFMAIDGFTNELKPGFYETSLDDYGNVHFTKIKMNKESYVTFNDSTSADVIKGFDDFTNNKESYDLLGVTYRRGFLLYGPPGTGKTTLVRQVSDSLINDKNGFVIKSNILESIPAAIKTLKSYYKDALIMIILEDIDVILQNYSTSYVLNIIDGVENNDNVIFFATTNHIENLDDNIKKRPSRFDTVIKIDYLSKENRLIYIKSLYNELDNIKEKQLEKIADRTDGFTVAQLKEVVILVEIYKNSIDDAIDRLVEMRNNNDSSFDDNFTNNTTTKLKSVGFLAEIE